LISLARSSLIYEWRRYLAAVFALGFSALLLYIQTGLMLGYSISMTAILNNSQADIWISDQRLKTFEWGAGLNPSQNECYLRMHPEILSVKPFYRAWCSGKTDAGESIGAMLFGVEPDDSCLLMPQWFIEEFGESLKEPMTVVIDRSFAKNVGLKIGDYTELNGKRVKVVGITDGYKNDQGGFVFTSDYTFRAMPGWKWAQYIMLKLKNSERAELTARELNEAPVKNSRIKAWTKSSLFWQSQKWRLLESPSSLTFIFLSILSIFIGVAITNQSLRSAILASLKEYAALRALGVSKHSLCAVVLEQSLWIGLAGLALAGVLTYIFSFIAVYYKLPFCVPLWFILPSTVLLLFVSFLSGLFSLMVLYKTEPAELLR